MRLSPAEDAELTEHILLCAEEDALARVSKRERCSQDRWRADREACEVLWEKLQAAEERGFWLEQLLSASEQLVLQARFERDQAYRVIDSLRDYDALRS